MYLRPRARCSALVKRKIKHCDMTLIKLTNIRKSFCDGESRQRAVLQGVELEVKCGDVISICGVSGSGKTTLLSILGTMLPADEGEYLFDGERIGEEVDLSGLRNRRIGFLFQDHRLMPQYTAWENILLPLLADCGATTTEQESYAQQLMDMLNISSLKQQYPNTLSGGEASRVALCRALVRKPDLLLADEPTGQLDEGHSAQVAELIRQVNRELGTTIVIVTHSESLAQIADRRFTLKDGILNELR